MLAAVMITASAAGFFPGRGGDGRIAVFIIVRSGVLKARLAAAPGGGVRERSCEAAASDVAVASLLNIRLKINKIKKARLKKFFNSPILNYLNNYLVP